MEDWGSNPSRNIGNLSSPPCPEYFWDLRSLLSNQYEGLLHRCEADQLFPSRAKV